MKFDFEIILPATGLYCLVTPALYEELTEFLSRYPVRMHGISADGGYTIQGSRRPLYRLEVPPKKQALALRFAEFVRSWTAGNIPKNPVIIDISATGDFVATISSTKPVHHA
jgi:hypothetical protein